MAHNGPYGRAKQSYLAEDYASIIPACEEEMVANLHIHWKVNDLNCFDCR
jgi:hypothetical protein